MSHVDDGTLHAYLDGELSPVEHERMDQHLAGCDGCRARLVEERELVARAGRLLGLAAPPERAAPPFQDLRRPRRGGGLRLPLAWAATVTLAIGLGWFARGTMRSSDQPRELVLDSGAVAARAAAPRTGTSAQDQIAASPVPPATAPRLATSAPLGRAEPRRDQPSAAGAGDVAGALAQRQEANQRFRAAPAAPPVAKVAAPAEAAPANALADEERAGAPEGWTIIEAKQARDLLGVDPAVIPGYPTRALRSNPANPRQVVVEQAIGGMVVQLFEQRSAVESQDARPSANAAGAMGYAANERLARYVGPLRVEIAGAIAVDSLSKLLDLVR